MSSLLIQFKTRDAAMLFKSYRDDHLFIIFYTYQFLSSKNAYTQIYTILLTFTT